MLCLNCPSNCIVIGDDELRYAFFVTLCDEFLWSRQAVLRINRMAMKFSALQFIFKVRDVYA